MGNIATFEAQKGVLQGEQPAPLGPIRYCLYSRKSTEQDELQALSIESQVKEMLSTAEQDGLLVTEIRRESHSAKGIGSASGIQPPNRGHKAEAVRWYSCLGAR